MTCWHKKGKPPGPKKESIFYALAYWRFGSRDGRAGVILDLPSGVIIPGNMGCCATLEVMNWMG